MSIILCDVHGESGFNPYVSNELVDKISKNIFLAPSEIKRVNVKFFDEEIGEEIFDIQYWMSKEAFEFLSAADLYEIISDEDEKKLDALFDPIMKGGGICDKCFREYLERSKRTEII